MIDFSKLLGDGQSPAALPRLFAALRAFAPVAFEELEPAIEAVPPAALVEAEHAFWSTDESVALLERIFAALDAADAPSNDGIEPVATCGACRVESSAFVAGRRDWSGALCPECKKDVA